jgi:oxygen-dependent protoporphyrinogen oxidase
MKALAPLPTAVPSSAPLFYTLREGVGSLPTLLATRLLERGVRIRTSTPVTAIRPTPAGSHAYEVDTATTTTPANYVVLATPPQVTGALVGFLGEFSDELRRLPSASAAMITLCVPRGNTRLPATGTGVLVPLKTPWRNGDSFLITALTFLDRKWPHLARDEDLLLRVHVGRIDDRRGLEMSDDELVARVREELAVIVGAWPHEGESVVVRWHDALPQYLVGHHDLVTRVRAASEARGIFLAGKTYDGVGIPASIGSGRRAGREILSRLAD